MHIRTEKTDKDETAAEPKRRSRRQVLGRAEPEREAASETPGEAEAANETPGETKPEASEA